MPRYSIFFALEQTHLLQRKTITNRQLQTRIEITISIRTNAGWVQLIDQ